MKPETKIFEVRDRATFMVVMATSFIVADVAENRTRRLLKRTGFATYDRYVILHPMNSHKASYDPYDFHPVTLRPVHQELIENWDNYEHGAVIDAEFLRGERDAPRESELV